MSDFRVLVEVTAEDLDALVQFFEETTQSIRENLPGTHVWNTYTSPELKRALIYEAHEDEAAAEEYESYMREQGLARRAFDLFTSVRVIILNPVYSSVWSEIAQRANSEILLPTTSLKSGS